MPGDPTRTVGSTAALRVAVRRHPRTGADLHPPSLGARAMAFPVSCRPGLARHLRRRSSHYRALGARVGTVAAANPTADLEIPDHGPPQRWPAQLCIGPAAVLGDSRVAGRRPRRITRRPSSIVIRMSGASLGAASATSVRTGPLARPSRLQLTARREPYGESTFPRSRFLDHEAKRSRMTFALPTTRPESSGPPRFPIGPYCSVRVPLSYSGL